MSLYNTVHLETHTSNHALFLCCLFNDASSRSESDDTK
jgi:hypothetical protein